MRTDDVVYDARDGRGSTLERARAVRALREHGFSESEIEAEIDRVVRSKTVLTIIGEVLSPARFVREERPGYGNMAEYDPERDGALCEYCEQGMRKADGCTFPQAKIGGRWYPRVRYGDETDDWGAAEGLPCHDCGAKPGHYHHLGCDVERTPAGAPGWHQLGFNEHVTELRAPVLVAPTPSVNETRPPYGEGATLPPFPRFLLTFEANDPETGAPTGDHDARHCIDPDAPVQTLCGLVAGGECGDDDTGATLAFEYDEPEVCPECEDRLEARVRGIMEARGYADHGTGGGCMAWARPTPDGGDILICTVDNRLYGAPDFAQWLVGRYDKHGAFLNFEPVMLGEAIAIAEVLPAPEGQETEGTVADARPWLVRALATRFSMVLRAWLTPEEMDEVRSRNAAWAAKGEPGICASHDFCDANMAANEAWASIYGVDFLAMADVVGGDDHTDRLNDAWTLAKREGFTLAPVAAKADAPPELDEILAVLKDARDILRTTSETHPARDVADAARTVAEHAETILNYTF